MVFCVTNTVLFPQSFLSESLYPHQVEAVVFLDSVQRGILADVPGLEKTSMYCLSQLTLILSRFSSGGAHVAVKQHL